jgi:hypothetical protein
MADTQICCGVHTLVEDIDHGRLHVTVASASLAEMDKYEPEIARGIRADGQAIATAHKFDFSGWEGESVALSGVLMETGFTMVEAGLATLPFPAVVFCQRFRSGGDHWNEMVVLLRTAPDVDATGIDLQAFHRVVNVTGWTYHGITTGLRRSGGQHHWMHDPDGVFDAEDQEYWSAMPMQFAMSALAALSSRGPEVRVQPAPEKLNTQRAKKGRPPIFEYRIVEIPAWAKEKAEAGGGTHASPRLHWRRGHERRLPSGTKTFVHAHLVGAAENGFIHKDYAVAPPAKP